MHAIVVGADMALVSKLVSRLRSIGNLEVVGVAHDGRQGVRLAKELAPDLVVSQFIMPDMTGPSLARALKSNGARPIVVIVSARGLPEHEVLAQRAGADGYLPSSSLDEFVPLVTKLIRRD